VALVGEKINSYRVVAGKPEGKRPLARYRHRREVNMKMDLKEIGWNDVSWIHMAQDWDKRRTAVNILMNLWV
jgi:hypothetical protein